TCAVSLPEAELRLPRGLRAGPRCVSWHHARDREGGIGPGRGALGPRGPHAAGARADGDRPRLSALLAHLAPGCVPHAVRLPVRGAERREPRGDGLRRGADRPLPGPAGPPEIPGALDGAAIPRPG